jgi:hypothetical protein
MEKKQIKRTWAWQPEANTVTFYGTANQGGQITYNRSMIKDQPSDKLKKEDPDEILRYVVFKKCPN